MVIECKRVFLTTDKAVNFFVAIIKGWEGVKGNEDIELQLREKARPIAEHMLKVVEKELNRLLGYFLERSTSPCASPLVCAPKATAPWMHRPPQDQSLHCDTQGLYS